MDRNTFDDFTRSLAIGTSRRRVLRGLIGGAAALAGVKATDTAAAGKTTICHFPPDNPANVQIISVGNPALPDHFAHGDMVLGECCVYSECAPTMGDCGVLVDCLADQGSPSSCVYSDDSSMCGGGDICNGLATCQGGTCGVGTPLDCSGYGDQCNVGACDPDVDGGCYPVPLDDGISCNNGAGTCSAGGCIPTCQESSTCDCLDAANAGLGCNNGEGTCQNGGCVPTCAPNCTCSFVENEGQGCNGGEGVCTDGACVQTCAVTSSCDCSDSDNEGLGCNGGEGTCQGDICVQTCAATSSCDCADADNEGLGCNGGEGVCTDGECVQTCAATSTCDCSDDDNAGLGCDDGAGTCQGGACVPNCGSISGQITSSANGSGIAGATVTVAGQTTPSDTNGNYSFACVPVGSQEVAASADGYGNGSNTVTVTANQDVTANVVLVPESTTDQITIVLTWNPQPDDLDSHLTGPDGSGGRFHVWYQNQQPVPHAKLDVDDVDGNGPETVTVIEALGGAFVAGDYHYWVYNYSNGSRGMPPDFTDSGATVTIYKDGVQTAQYDVSAASGSQALFNWNVVTLSLAANGDLNLTPIQVMAGGGNGSEP
ncbi:MAG TPA: carboxypeptidase regulatory-like domain-containing protein [Thermomicrobiales bacterium]|nr:carboxypeptidase regulatory-like domain-containing protein [Thermomicrobiales bacterium]